MFTPPAPMMDINGSYAGVAKPLGFTRLQRAFGAGDAAGVSSDFARGADPVSRPTFGARLAAMFGRRGGGSVSIATRINDQRGDYAPKSPGSTYDPAPAPTVAAAASTRAAATSRPIIDPAYWPGTN